jgi:hypothetical protein
MLPLQVARPVYRTRGETENVAEDMKAKLQEALSNIKKVHYCSCQSLQYQLTIQIRASTRGLLKNL